MQRTIENPLLKDTITFVRTAAETKGEVSELHVSLRPGGGNPLHYHTSYTETFLALQGTLGLELAGRRKIFLQPGESYLIEAGKLHRFFNATQDEIKFRIEIRPGHQGFEETLRIGYGLAVDGRCYNAQTPKDIRHLALCLIRSDMRLPGLPSVLTPLFRIIAVWARRQGVEQELLDRYCR